MLVAVELLVVSACPNKASALDLTRAALEDLDVPAAVSTTVIASNDRGTRRASVGASPLVNGRGLR